MSRSEAKGRQLAREGEGRLQIVYHSCGHREDMDLADVLPGERPGVVINARYEPCPECEEKESI